jgi:hypothetical protein
MVRLLINSLRRLVIGDEIHYFTNHQQLTTNHLNSAAGWHAFGGRLLNIDTIQNLMAAAESMAHNESL